MVVDSQPGALSEQVIAAIQTLSSKPIRHVVNTTAEPDHLGGNEALAKAGATRTGGVVVGQIGALGTANIIAHENLLNRVSAPSGGRAAVPFAAQPTETFFGAKKDMLFNGEGVQFLHQPAAHTDGDIMVYFRRSDVLVTGDLVLDHRLPGDRRGARGAPSRDRSTPSTASSTSPFRATRRRAGR